MSLASRVLSVPFRESRRTKKPLLITVFIDSRSHRPKIEMDTEMSQAATLQSVAFLLFEKPACTSDELLPDAREVGPRPLLTPSA